VLQLLAGSFVQVGSELRERSQFTILGQCQTDTATELLDDLGLGRTTNAGYRDTGVDSRTDTCVEEVGFQEDLAVGNGNQLVGTKAETSPAWVSMIGSAVSEPVLPFTSPLVSFSTSSALMREARSSRRECR